MENLLYFLSRIILGGFIFCLFIYIVYAFFFMCPIVFKKIKSIYKKIYVYLTILKLTKTKIKNSKSLARFLINSYSKNSLYNIDFIYFNLREYKKSGILLEHKMNILYAIIFGYVYGNDRNINIDVFNKILIENSLVDSFQYALELIKNRLPYNKLKSTNILNDLEIAYLCENYKNVSEHYKSAIDNNIICSKSFFENSYFSLKFESKLKYLFIKEFANFYKIF